MKPSFVPNREQRDMIRLGKSQIEERSRNINWLQKFLEGANIKLGSLLLDIEGKSSTQLLELIIGKEDFAVDDVRCCMHGRMKSTPEEIIAAVEGYITPTQRKFFAHVTEVIREQTGLIEITDTMIKGSFSNEQEQAVKAMRSPENTRAAKLLTETKR